jgi:hypothetical protein
MSIHTYFLQVFYKNGTDSDVLDRMEIPGCSSPCLYSNFVSLVHPYQVDFPQWNSECNLKAINGPPPPSQEDCSTSTSGVDSYDDILNKILETGWNIIALLALVILTVLGVTWLCFSKNWNLDRRNIITKLDYESI